MARRLRLRSWLRIAAGGLLAGWLAVVAAGARAEVAVPALEARVTDLTGTLAPQSRQTLEQALAALEARKGAQIAVLIVPTTAPEPIEEYSLRVAERWKLGRAGVDDGVLLLVAKDDRRLRIEVGYGLEGAIPDAVAKRVISEVIVPYFQRGDYAGGVTAGVDRLVRLVEGEPLPSPRAAGRNLSEVFDQLFPIGLLALFMIGPILRALAGRLVGATLTGGLAALVAWLMTGLVLIAAGLGLVAFFITLAGSTVGRGAGRWSSGGGGFGGGGGFRGGGGGFGGGGASGRW
jgi:uncharacterized protein